MRRDCPICGSDQKRQVLSRQFVTTSHSDFGDGYQVVICNECDFAYADEIQSQDALDAYYAGNTATAIELGRANSDLQFSEQEHHKDQHNNSLSYILPFLSKTSRIIDIGCGSGHLLNLIVNNGFQEVWGLDPSPIASEIARKRYGLSVFQGSLLDELDIGKFDFMILSHVLEHIEDVNIFLLKLKNILTPQGLVYIEVPDAYNFSLSADPALGLCDVHLKDIFVQFTPEHINFFSTNSLENLMRANGFENVVMEPNLSTMGVISSVWKRSELRKDRLIELKLKEYVNISAKVLDEISPVINKLRADVIPIYVWGAGLHTQRLLAHTQLSELNIQAFIDSNSKYHGSELNGVMIIAPERLHDAAPHPILVSSRKAQEEIVSQIRSMRLKNQVICLYQPNQSGD
jgi:2-polyprenyl-3-methyl-5-hydroxy-6-metoxy-1,4-benzoquinol methylase